LPLVSVILTTRDRPRFLQIALACYQHQTYPERELIVVDDGDQAPASEAAISAVGGRLVRVPPGTPLGTKLNHGVREARGSLCQKMDDDDWYAPRFVETMVAALLASQESVCRPTVAFLMPFLFFEVAPWEIRASVDDNIPGATLLFDRADWEERPFRAVPRDEDVWFVLDQLRAGRTLLPVNAVETFLAVRHRGSTGDRGHTWTHQFTGETLEDYLRDRPLYERRPETLLPEWALASYRVIREEIRSAGGVETTPAGGKATVLRSPFPRDVSRSNPPVANPDPARVLILTPLKDAADFLPDYCARILDLTYPGARLSLGFLESDSSDETFSILQRQIPKLRDHFCRVGAWQRDFGYQLPRGVPRWTESIQIERRSVLAKSRNHLLFRALDDEDWVLWLDVDVIEYPPDLIERLLATGRDIVQPHCVRDYGGPTFDANGWRDHGRYHLDDLRGEGELVELDAVGGTVLLVRADAHRDGLIFPAFQFGIENPLVRPGRGELETEGLGIMAHELGYQCWGMTRLEVIHRRQ